MIISKRRVSFLTVKKEQYRSIFSGKTYEKTKPIRDSISRTNHWLSCSSSVSQSFAMAARRFLINHIQVAQKQLYRREIRETTSKTCSVLFNRNPKEFLHCFVTIDETWVNWYIPTIETIGFTRWTWSKESEDRVFGPKCDGHHLWNALGVICVDYLQKGKITVAYYVDLLSWFNADLKKRPSHLAKKKVLFHQDNAPVHTSAIPTAKLVKFHYELVPHSRHSPDWVPCDGLP